MITANFTGLKRNAPPYKLQEGEYFYASNLRMRKDVLVPVNAPVELTEGLPTTGKVQGVYTADNLVLVFKGGEAFYKNFTTDSDFMQIEGIAMDATVEYIYAQPVPASTVNFGRKSQGANASDGVDLTNSLNSSPICVVIQDGISQPNILFPDGTARVAGTYENWSLDSREYVPIMLDMLWDGTTLYGVSPDRKRLLRSVSGRPLDFMIAIDTEGNKLAKASGDADALSHAVGYGNITALALLNSQERSIFVGTEQVCYSVKPNLDDLLFAEPTFINQIIFDTGVLNSRSYIQLLGDTHFLDLSGIRSFNSVRQTQDEIRNTPFSEAINDLFEDDADTLVQSATSCAVRYNGYGLYSVDTIFGAAVLVYDEQRKTFVSVDQWSGVGKINQFARLEIEEQKALIFSTVDDKVYRAFTGATEEEAQIYPRELHQPGKSVKMDMVEIDLFNVREAGLITVDLYTDGELTKSLNIYVPVVQDTATRPFSPPLEGGSSRRSYSAKVDVSSFGLSGRRVGIGVRWNFNASISAIMSREGKPDNRDNKQQAVLNRSNSAEYAITFPLPLDMSMDEVVTLEGANLVGLTDVYIGGVRMELVSTTDSTVVFIPRASAVGKMSLIFPDYYIKSSIDYTVL